MFYNYLTFFFFCVVLRKNKTIVGNSKYLVFFSVNSISPHDRIVRRKSNLKNYSFEQINASQQVDRKKDKKILRLIGHLNIYQRFYCALKKSLKTLAWYGPSLFSVIRSLLLKDLSFISVQYVKNRLPPNDVNKVTIKDGNTCAPLIPYLTVYQGSIYVKTH